MALFNRLGNAVFRRSLARRTECFTTRSSSSFRRAFSAHATTAEEDEVRRSSGLSIEEKKAKISSAWNSSAEAYVGAVQGGGVKGGPPPAGMSVGYKLAARLVNSLSNKRCEAVVIEGKEMCKARATHGEVGEGSTACELHKTEGMVPLKGAGGPVVLDVASAGGEPAITIAKAVPDATVHATDVAPAMVELIRKRVADAGVSNVTADVADGESLAGFADGSVDAVTCTWGLMFMPEWERAIQEFSRVLRSDGLVTVMLWEKHDDSVFQRMSRVLETLTPGFQGLVDPEALGDDGGSSVLGAMEDAGLVNVTASKFSVPVVLPEGAGPRDIWEQWALSTPLVQTLSSLEAKGRTNVRQEALEIFEKGMEEDWAEGRAPLGLEKVETDGEESGGDVSSGGGGGGGSPAAHPPRRIFYVRALFIVGHKDS